MGSLGSSVDGGFHGRIGEMVAMTIMKSIKVYHFMEKSRKSINDSKIHHQFIIYVSANHEVLVAHQVYHDFGNLQTCGISQLAITGEYCEKPNRPRPGQGNYAAANANLDAFAPYWSAKAGPALGNPKKRF